MKVHERQADVGMGKLKVVLNQVLYAVRKEGEGVGMSLSVKGKDWCCIRGSRDGKSCWK